MKMREWLELWDLTHLKFNVHILDSEWKPEDKDREAAWDLYVEMLTRIVTQPLPETQGDEKAALESVHALFPITREVLSRRGKECVHVARIAVVILNQVLRPFTAKWHKESLSGGFENPNRRAEFRTELSELQQTLRRYTRSLADIAGVEDLTQLDADGGAT